MNHAGLVVGYDTVLQCMKEISNYHKDKLRSIGRHCKPFIDVYDNFEQSLGVQDQRSNHNKKFCVVVFVKQLHTQYMHGLFSHE